MAILEENLEKILSARYGEEVRTAIHDSIKQSYESANGTRLDAISDFLYSFNSMSHSIISQINLIDNNDVIVGYYVSSSGNLFEVNGADKDKFKTTNYIPIKPNVKYYCNPMLNGSQALFLDKNFNILNHVVYSPNNSMITVPSDIVDNACFVRISIGSNDKSLYLIDEPTFLDNVKNEPFTKHFPKIPIYSIEGSIPYSGNLIDLNNIFTQAYPSYASGNLQASNDFVTTDFIKIEPNTNYYVYSKNFAGRQAAFYDVNKTYISGFLKQDSETEGPIISPVNAFYVRIGFHKYNYDNKSMYFGHLKPDTNNISFTNRYQRYLLNTGNENNIIVVDKSGIRSSITSVSDGVSIAKENDIVFVYDGLYQNEIIKAANKRVSIIGESRDGTIIENDTATYSTPPIEIASGCLRNLTIRALEGNGVSEDDNGWNNYAVHADFDTLADSSLTIENCSLYCDLNAAIGIGLRKNGHLSIRNSDIISRDTCGLFFHDSAKPDLAGNQYIDVIDCVINSINSATVIRIEGEKNQGKTQVRFIRNIMASKKGTPTWTGNNNSASDGTNTEVIDFSPVIGFEKTYDSNMNTLTDFNK